MVVKDQGRILIWQRVAKSVIKVMTGIFQSFVIFAALHIVGAAVVKMAEILKVLGCARRASRCKMMSNQKKII